MIGKKILFAGAKYLDPKDKRNEKKQGEIIDAWLSDSRGRIYLVQTSDGVEQIIPLRILKIL